jgi:hypothetical protein
VGELPDALSAVLRDEDRDLDSPCTRRDRDEGPPWCINALPTTGPGNAGDRELRASDRATGNTQKLCYIRVTSLLPLRVLIKSDGGPALGAKTDRREFL